MPQEALSDICDQEGSCWELQVEVRSPFYVPRTRKGAMGVEWDQEGPKNHVLVPRAGLFLVNPFPFPMHPLFLMEVNSGSDRVVPIFSVHPLIPDQLWGLLPLTRQATTFLSKGLRLEDTFIQPADGIKPFHPSAQAISQMRTYPNLCM